MGDSIESLYEASEADRGIQWRGGLDNAQGFWYNGRMIRSNSGVDVESGRLFQSTSESLDSFSLSKTSKQLRKLAKNSWKGA